MLAFSSPSVRMSAFFAKRKNKIIETKMITEAGITLLKVTPEKPPTINALESYIVSGKNVLTADIAELRILLIAMPISVIEILLESEPKAIKQMIKQAQNAPAKAINGR